MATASTRFVPLEGSPQDPLPEIRAGFVQWTYYPVTADVPFYRVVYTVRRTRRGIEVDIVGFPKVHVVDVTYVPVPAEPLGGG